MMDKDNESPSLLYMQKEDDNLNYVKVAVRDYVTGKTLIKKYSYKDWFPTPPEVVSENIANVHFAQVLEGYQAIVYVEFSGIYRDALENLIEIPFKCKVGLKQKFTGEFARTVLINFLSLFRNDSL